MKNGLFLFCLLGCIYINGCIKPTTVKSISKNINNIDSVMLSKELTYNNLNFFFDNAEETTIYIFAPNQRGKRQIDSLNISEKRVLKTEEWQNMKTVLQNEKGYNFKIFKNCLYFPSIGFRLSSKKFNGKNFDIVADMNCNTWFVSFDKKKYQLEADGLHQQVIKQAKELFPKNEIVMNME